MTEAEPDRCAAVLRRFLLQGSSLRRSESSRFPIFAFRLHQFFTRGDTVWATLERRPFVILNSQEGREAGRTDKRLFPMVFCRHCGTAYYRVKVIRTTRARTFCASSRRRKEPAPVKIGASTTTTGKGCVRLPVGAVPLAERRWGRFARALAGLSEGDLHPGRRAHPRRRPRRCADNHLRRGDRSHRLGGQGVPVALIRRTSCSASSRPAGWRTRGASVRSATSWRLSAWTAGARRRRSLRSARSLSCSKTATEAGSTQAPEPRTTVRTSLQAGHFSDFIAGRTASFALHRATQARGPSGLSHGDLSRSVFDAMQLRFDEYAADPEVRGAGAQRDARRSAPRDRLLPLSRSSARLARHRANLGTADFCDSSTTVSRRRRRTAGEALWWPASR